MKTSLTLSALIILFASCNSKTASETPVAAENTDQPETEIAPIDTTPKVTGIGGIFFYTEDPDATKDWYAKNLGLEFNEWGSTSFDSRNVDRPDEINSLQWTLFKTGDAYFSPSKKEFMVNYQVQNIEGLVRNLKANGVTIVDSIATYEYGKFVHLMDPDGNKIELYEPIDNGN